LPVAKPLSWLDTPHVRIASWHPPISVFLLFWATAHVLSLYPGWLLGVYAILVTPTNLAAALGAGAWLLGLCFQVGALPVYFAAGAVGFAVGLLMTALLFSIGAVIALGFLGEWVALAFSLPMVAWLAFVATLWLYTLIATNWTLARGDYQRVMS
jgi:hypothetical protein